MSAELVTFDVEAGALFPDTSDLKRTVLSNFKSELQINLLDGLHLKSEYPSLTPTSASENSVLLFHEPSLNVLEAHCAGGEMVEFLQSTSG